MTFFGRKEVLSRLFSWQHCRLQGIRTRADAQFSHCRSFLFRRTHVTLLLSEPGRDGKNRSPNAVEIIGKIFS
jgi:hypothetical protein